MKKTVQEYIKSYSNMLSFFKVESNDDFFIKPMLNCNWRIKDNDGFYIISYWSEEIGVVEAVVVKKNNKPLIYKTRDYTMVVAIECVRIGLVFRNISLK